MIMNQMDIFLLMIVALLGAIVLIIFYAYQKEHNRRETYNYLSRIRSVIDEYPDMFVDNQDEVWVLDYLIAYYADSEENIYLHPRNVLDKLLAEKKVNRRKVEFLLRWLHYGEIINLDFATINLSSFINGKK